MKQKLLLLIASILLSVHAWGQNVGDKFTADEISYRITSVSPATVEVTSKQSGMYSGSIIIPANVSYLESSYSVTAIGHRAFSYCTSLSSISIPMSVTTIVNWAFSECKNLASINLSQSVIDIQKYAFVGCPANIIINENNQNYSSLDGVLYNRNKTELIHCPTSKSGHYTILSSVKTIKTWAFYNCTELSSITIPQSVTVIESGAFIGCQSLTSATIPQSVTDIESMTFYNCIGLTSVTIPSSVKSIGQNAFYDCRSITSITIPESVTKIENNAFHYCGNIFIVAQNNPNYSSLDGVLFDKYKTELIQCPTSKSGHYNIPSSVKTIRSFAFYNCRELTSISIPESVTEIGYEAFYYCQSLIKVTIPSSITSIGMFAFLGCSSLESVSIPESVTEIYYGAFAYCGNKFNVDVNNPNYSSFDGVLFNKDKSELLYCPTSKTGLYFIPSTVAVIREYAFINCNSLKYIIIPTSVTAIYDDSFSNCTGMFIVDENNPYYSSFEGVLFNKNKSEIIKCPKSKSGQYTIPTSVSVIGHDAFVGCKSLSAINIPESVTTIGSGAFSYCNNLTSITIPPSVTSVNDSVFFHCDNLTSIYCVNSNPEIINWSTFAEFNKSNCTLFIPKGSLEAYRANDNWQGFKAIIETDTYIVSENKNILPMDPTCIFPNPAKEGFSISTSEPCTVDICTQSGAPVKSIALASAGTFRVDGMLAGMYFVTVRTATATQSHKLVVE